MHVYILHATNHSTVSSTYIIKHPVLSTSVHNISTVYSYMLQPDHSYIKEGCISLSWCFQISLVVGALVALEPLHTAVYKYIYIV